MPGEFLLFKKNTAIKNCSLKSLKILKELKKLYEEIYKSVKKQLM